MARHVLALVLVLLTVSACGSPAAVPTEAAVARSQVAASTAASPATPLPPTPVPASATPRPAVVETPTGTATMPAISTAPVAEPTATLAPPQPTVAVTSATVTAAAAEAASATVAPPAATPTALSLFDAPTPLAGVTETAGAVVMSSAPQLAAPPDGERLERGAVVSWQGGRELAADEYYVLTFTFTHEQETWYDVSWLKETSWTVPDYFGPPHSTSGWYEWKVVLMRQTGTEGDGKPVGEAVSDESRPRTIFVSVGGAGPGDTPPPTATPCGCY